MNKDHDEMRKELWIRAWVGTASASNCTNKTAADKWADHALEQFDRRFKENPND